MIKLKLELKFAMLFLLVDWYGFFGFFHIFMFNFIYKKSEPFFKTIYCMAKPNDFADDLTFLSFSIFYCSYKI